jgi:predicted ATP-dependent endonuclease of OLD family
MQALVESILVMARQGVQIFLTTHSYVILKELDLQATPDDNVRLFSLSASKKDGTQVTTADELSELDPNAILQEYGSLYNRDIRRASGRSAR